MAEALNFETADCRVEGGCDLYTTKLTRGEKKLYKDIEKSLETQHYELLRLAQALPPPQGRLVHLHISNSSPFGSMGQSASRRTFAHLIAVMNASHDNYDFSNAKPIDFVREYNINAVTSKIDETMYNLRGRAKSNILLPPHHGMPGTSSTPNGSPCFSSRSWKAMDNQMTLQECEVYSYSPEEDPFDENALWSHDFFFLNRRRKRVLYFYVRVSSILGHSPSADLTTPIVGVKRSRPLSAQSFSFIAGASKRAKHWYESPPDDFEDGWKHYDDWDSLTMGPEEDGVDADEALSGDSL